MYERYAARILRFCVHRLGDEDDAADAVQDTFMRAWLALRDGAEIRHPLPWLVTIADNVCVSRFRARAARVVTTELYEGARAESSEPVGEVAGLAAALRALPDRQRRALLRRELQGYSYDEIGAELGVSRASVAALLHRARLAVAESLRDARRGIGAFVPIAWFWRAPFQSGAAGVTAAGTAAVAIAIAPLAGPPPTSTASSSSPHPAAVIELAGDPRHLAAATPGSTARAHEGVGRASKAAGRSLVRKTRVGAFADGEQRVLATEHLFPGTGRASPYLPKPRSSPTGGPSADTTPSGPETEAGPDAPTSTVDDRREVPEEAPAGEQGNASPSGTSPGHQPKGSKGHSASAPGQADPGPAGTGPPEGAPANAGQGQGGGQGQSGNPEPQPSASNAEAAGHSEPQGNGGATESDPPPAHSAPEPGGQPGSGHEPAPAQGHDGAGGPPQRRAP